MLKTRIFSTCFITRHKNNPCHRNRFTTYHAQYLVDIKIQGYSKWLSGF